jgi:hypothetical protein
MTKVRTIYILRGASETGGNLALHGFVAIFRPPLSRFERCIGAKGGGTG